MAEKHTFGEWCALYNKHAESSQNVIMGMMWEAEEDNQLVDASTFQQRLMETARLDVRQGEAINRADQWLGQQ